MFSSRETEKPAYVNTHREAADATRIPSFRGGNGSSEARNDLRIAFSAALIQLTSLSGSTSFVHQTP